MPLCCREITENPKKIRYIFTSIRASSKAVMRPVGGIPPVKRRAAAVCFCSFFFWRYALVMTAEKRNHRLSFHSQYNGCPPGRKFIIGVPKPLLQYRLGEKVVATIIIDFCFHSGIIEYSNHSYSDCCFPCYLHCKLP